MRVIDIAGRMQTAGTWEKTAEAEADAQALLRHTRAGLRRMLDGNEAFHVDPMAAPAVMLVGVDCAGGPDTAAIVTYTRTGSTVRIDTVFTTPASQLATTLPVAAAPDVWHTEAPTVAGVYLSRVHGRIGERWFDGRLFHALGCDMRPARSRPAYEDNNNVEWLRLIGADTPPIADWRPGDQVPAAERKQGLWFSNVRGRIGVAYRALDVMGFYKEHLYRPAALGVHEGEAYDEARYGVTG